MSTSYRKQLRAILRIVEEQGGQVRWLKSGNIQVIPPDPDKPLSTIHGSPSDVRATKNLLADLRRSGFRV